MKGPDPKSIRSKKRANRTTMIKGLDNKANPFVNLETSSRKHRRANRRLLVSCNILRAQHKPGEKVAVPIPGKASPSFHTAGGSVKFH